MAMLQAVSVSNADLRYSTERYECPWTEARDQAWGARIKQSERLKAVRLAVEAKAKYERQRLLEKDAANITLKDMDEMLVSVEACWANMHRNKDLLGKISTCYGSMFSSSRKKEVTFDEIKGSDFDGESVTSLHSGDSLS